MEISKIAKAWVEMWELEIDSPKRNSFEWVSDFEYEAEYHKPELAIELVLEVLKLKPKSNILEVLAAGPLEQVLANHGEKIISQVEFIASTNLDFAHLLAGVWKNSMSNDVWDRVKCICNKLE